MGSIARVNVNYLNLKDFLETTSLPFYGTFLWMEKIYIILEITNEGIIIPR